MKQLSLTLLILILSACSNSQNDPAESFAAPASPELNETAKIPPSVPQI